MKSSFQKIKQVSQILLYPGLILVAAGVLLPNNLFSFIGIIMACLAAFIMLFGIFFFLPMTSSSPVFVRTGASKDNEDKNNQTEDNPWAKTVKVPYPDYLAMRDLLMKELRWMETQDEQRIMTLEKSWTPTELYYEVYAQTTTGKNFVEDMVRAGHTWEEK